jgi:hypothetical protein
MALRQIAPLLKGGVQPNALEMMRKTLQWWSDLRRRSGTRIAVSAVVAVLGIAVGVMLQASQLSGKLDASDPRRLIASAKRSDRAGQARVGHLLYQITSTRLERMADPANSENSRLVARVDVRIADVQGSSDYIDNKTFHLLVDGEALTHENNINLTVYENSAVQASLIFVVPENTSAAELLVGRATEGVASIPLGLEPRRMADGS